PGQLAGRFPEVAFLEHASLSLDNQRFGGQDVFQVGGHQRDRSLQPVPGTHQPPEGVQEQQHRQNNQPPLDNSLFPDLHSQFLVGNVPPPRDTQDRLVKEVFLLQLEQQLAEFERRNRR